MPRLLLLLALLLLAGTVAAQTGPLLVNEIDQRGGIRCRARVVTPGVTRVQLLTRAVVYARQHLVGEDSSEAAAWWVDSTHHVVSGTCLRPVPGQLRYDLSVRAHEGSYSYEVSRMWVEAPSTGEQVPLSSTRYVPVELYWTRVPAQGAVGTHWQEVPTFVQLLTQQVEAMLAQLQAKMARP